jgi:hypothetical protein
MGDKKRNRIFTEFIRHTFSNHDRVADVAGGNGELGFLLQNELNREVTVVDPGVRPFPKWIRDYLDESNQGTLEPRRLKTRVDEVDFKQFNLIVAMHPDEATEPAIRAAISFGIDFAVVPCCPFPLEGKKQFGKEWIRYLAALAPDIRTTRLGFSGPNTCLWRRNVADQNEVVAIDERERIRIAVTSLPKVTRVLAN